MYVCTYILAFAHVILFGTSCGCNDLMIFCVQVMEPDRAMVSSRAYFIIGEQSI